MLACVQYVSPMFIQLCKTFEQAKIEEIQLQSLHTNSHTFVHSFVRFAIAEFT